MVIGSSDASDKPGHRRQILRQKAKDLSLSVHPAYKIYADMLRSEKVILSYNFYNSYSDVSIDWQNLPYGVSVAGGKLPTNRCSRKTVQVENLMLPVMKILNKIEGSKIKVVEFCAGSGFVALPLAHLYKHVEFVIIDCKMKSLDIARERIRDSNLTNVRIVASRIEEYTEIFDIGIALHACGIASDITIDTCIKSHAAFICCPCCIGKISLARTKPLSLKFQSILSEMQYCGLVRAADFSHSDQTFISSRSVDRERRLCKCYVEEDRLEYAREMGYETALILMQPVNASPKNDVLIGWPCGSSRLSLCVSIVENSVEDYLFGNL